MRWKGFSSKTGVLVLLLGGLALGVPALAQEATPPAVDTGDGVIQPGAPRGLDTQFERVNVSEMDLAQMIRLLAEQAGVNVTIGQDVKGTVSCALTNVTARSALESILQANGYDFIEKSGVLIVVTRAQRQEMGEAPPLRKIVRKTFELPFTGREVEFVPTTCTGGGSTAAAAPAGSGAGRGVEQTLRNMLSSNGKLIFFERQHLVIIQDEEEVVQMIEDFINALWAMPVQVFIDSKLLEVSLNEGDTLGLRWNILTKVGESGKHALNPLGTDTNGTMFGTVGPRLLGPTETFSYGIVNANIEAVVEALRTRDRVDLQSNPRVLVTNHRTATIVVGQEIPYTETEESTGTGVLRTTEFKEVAVRLEVTPHVSKDGLIFMDVHPSSKAVVSYVEDTNQPVLSTREAVTSVAIRDGSTLIIGGLVQRNRTKSWAETPFLAKIPVIGLLFRQKHHADVKNDLIFLLSPRLVTEELMTAEIASKEGITAELPLHAGESAPGQPQW